MCCVNVTGVYDSMSCALNYAMKLITACYKYMYVHVSMIDIDVCIHTRTFRATFCDCVNVLVLHVSTCNLAVMVPLLLTAKQCTHNFITHVLISVNVQPSVYFECQ